MKLAHTSVLAGALLFAACGGGTPTPEAPPPPEPAPEPAPAEPGPAEPAPAEPEAPAEPAPAAAAPLEVPIQARSKSKVTGTVKLEEVEGGVKVTVHLENTPKGFHGAHFHQKADCSADDATSAGDHFNPEGHDHGRPPDGKRHLGDLGNIEVDAKGVGTLEIVIQGANLKPDDEKSFLGRAVIIHAKKDDGSQPSGNAGARIGCAEVKR